MHFSPLTMKHVELPLPSGIIGGFAFLFIDILCVWAIHRGLQALQGYFILRPVEKRKGIQLKRSRVPITEGELLKTSPTNVNLVLLNTFFFVLPLFAALGINGETVSRSIPIHRAYLLTINATNETFSPTGLVHSIYREKSKTGTSRPLSSGKRHYRQYQRIDIRVPEGE